MNDIEKSLKFYARIAGVLYILIIVFGIYSEVFVRSNLIVSGNADATVTNIMLAKTFYLSAFAGDFIMIVCDIAIAVIFYILLKHVNNTLAITASLFRLIQAAILGFNLLNYYAASLLVESTVYADIFEKSQIATLAFFFLNMHSYGYDLGLLFFAISNFILGYLIIKSKYFPTVLGLGIIAAAAVYLSGSMVRFLLPEFTNITEPLYILPFVVELSFALWLLIKGIKSHNPIES